MALVGNIFIRWHTASTDNNIIEHKYEIKKERKLVKEIYLNEKERMHLSYLYSAVGAVVIVSTCWDTHASDWRLSEHVDSTVILTSTLVDGAIDKVDGKEFGTQRSCYHGMTLSFRSDLSFSSRIYCVW